MKHVKTISLAAAMLLVSSCASTHNGIKKVLPESASRARRNRQEAK